MKALKIEDIKGFMSKLLGQDTFDFMLLSELELHTFNRFHIDGRLQEEWYDTEEWKQMSEQRYSSWNDIKPVAFSLIKGKKTPVYIKLVFVLPRETIRELFPVQAEQIEGLYWNLHYEKGELYIVTGTSLKIFTMDKGVEQQWDSWTEAFLKEKQIAYENR